MSASIKGLEHSAYGLLAVTGVGTSSLKFLGFLNDNAGALGVIMTFVFGVTGVCLTWFSYYRKDRQAEINKEEIRQLNMALKAIDERKRKK